MSIKPKFNEETLSDIRNATFLQLVEDLLITINRLALICNDPFSSHNLSILESILSQVLDLRGVQ